MLRARLATAAVAIPLLLALILLAPVWLYATVVVAIAIAGVVEYATMAFPRRRGEYWLTIGLGALLLGAAALDHAGPAHWYAGAVAATISGGLIWTLVARRDFEQGLADFGLLLVGVVYLALTAHFIWLREVDANGPRWVIFVLVIAMMGDSGGYFVGHAVGRHKLMPHVSPGKTVEGSLGILLSSLVGAAGAKLLLLPDRSWAELLVLGGTMSIVGQLGDLCESIMKRTFGVKESGWLFPGHGGVLDRVDSLLFPAALLYYHLSLFQ